ncbi:hypothetical protein [Sinorhizobium sp. BG8]|uniref:hypothetical protein n=1 Tax=Sinorhizobium sp. BG8 TaxID=2613773 RepID=UPI00193E861C|nr:hypothetical protein [Sinorhizobium sp. BG8]QRM55574.1 hypothetical protein F3Y30_14360 [Sinorhizobium sp. BG8]
MKKLIATSALGLAVMVSFSMPAMAETVVVTKKRVVEHREVQPGLVITDRGIAVRTYDDSQRCVTKTVKRETDDREVVKKTTVCR